MLAFVYHITSYFILLVFPQKLVCFLMRDRKDQIHKGGSRGGTVRGRRKGNHNQHISCEGKLFSVKEKIFCQKVLKFGTMAITQW